MGGWGVGRGTHDWVEQEEHVEASAEEHAEQPTRERRLARHREEGRQRHDGDHREWEERVAQKARVEGVVHRLGEGARDGRHVEGELEVPERLGDFCEGFRPLDVDLSNAGHDLHRHP